MEQVLPAATILKIGLEYFSILGYRSELKMIRTIAASFFGPSNIITTQDLAPARTEVAIENIKEQWSSLPPRARR